MLAHRLNRISERHRRFRDYTLDTLRIALREILACFPVYRTYIRAAEASERDRQVVLRAAAQAKRRNPALNAAVFDFVRDVLLLEQPPELDEAGRRDRGAVRRPLPTGHQPAGGQGRRGHGLLRQRALAFAQRGGRGSGPGGSERRRIPRRRRRSLETPAAVAHRHHDPRYQAQRGRPGADQRPLRDPASVAGHREPLRAAEPRPPPRGRRPAGPQPQRRISLLPDARRACGRWSLPTGRRTRSSWRRMQGHMDKAIHEAKQRTSWINPARGVRRGRPPVRGRRPGGPPEKPLPGRVPRPARADRALGPVHRLVAGRAETHFARACPTSTRARSFGTSAWSIRTTAARSISPGGRSCSPGWRSRRPPRPTAGPGPAIGP